MLPDFSEFESTEGFNLKRKTLYMRSLESMRTHYRLNHRLLATKQPAEDDGMSNPKQQRLDLKTRDEVAWIWNA